MLAAGMRLGPYEIISPLGAGGMGEVYRARDTRLGRDVAVKVLPAGVSSNPDSRSRFEREARAVSSLNHPHICTLHDVGRAGDTDFLVMELVEGETLAVRLEKGPLPTEPLLKTAIEVADALEKAHRAGIVHRDLKPGNIMLTKGGAKLMDFGLARATGLAAGPSGLSQSPTVSRPLTAEGTIVGTFQYMAPEQLEGKEADARSDLWALGAVLYEMATGRKAFQGKSQASLISAIMSGEPAPIVSITPMSPPALDRLVHACLAKDPEDRIQTAHDARLQLEWIRDAGSQAGIPAPLLARRRSRERLARILVGVLALIGIAAAALLLPRMMRPPAEAPVMRFAITAPAGVTMTTDPVDSAISPDGRTVVFLATDSTSTTRIWARPIGSLAARAITGTDNASVPFWSPDSRFVGFFADGKLKKVPIAGGAVEVLCDALDARGASWSRNGVIVFAPIAAGPIARVSADGGEPVEIMRPDTTKGENGLRWPAFLPDGKHYLVVGLPARQGHFDVYLGSLDSKERRRILSSAAAPVYVPPGYLIIVRNGRLMAQRFDPQRLRVIGDPIPLGEAPPLSNATGGRAVSAASTGILAHPEVGMPDTRLIWLNSSGRETGTLPMPAGRWDQLSLSPDAKRLVAARRNSATSSNLWMVEIARGMASRFTFASSGVPENIMWSPDGQWIAYDTYLDGPAEILRKRADGSQDEEMIHRSGALFMNLSQWTRDGRYLVFSQPDPVTGWDVWLLPLDGDRKAFPYLHSRFNERSGAVSPDGRWIAYESDESGRSEVYVQSFPTPGNKYRVSTSGAFAVFWPTGGREMILAGLDGVAYTVDVTTTPSFSAGTPRVRFRLRPDVAAIAGTYDGQRVLFSVPAGEAAPPSLVLELNWMSMMKK
jgi:Tol biopolymer transport system component